MTYDVPDGYVKLEMLVCEDLGEWGLLLKMQIICNSILRHGALSQQPQLVAILTSLIWAVHQTDQISELLHEKSDSLKIQSSLL